VQRHLKIVSREYILQRHQWIAKPLEDVFAFFADARNLEAITPPWLNFRILTTGPIEMRAGAGIVYRIAWHGIPVRWKTAITEWQPPYRFVDRQEKGPYRLWEHTHTFHAEAGGTAIVDTVRYALPFGPLGDLVHKLRVRRDVTAIFDYRHRAIRQLLT
jgi:ligand-binding SRPBCC domain-containing protein